MSPSLLLQQSRCVKHNPIFKPIVVGRRALMLSLQHHTATHHSNNSNSNDQEQNQKQQQNQPKSQSLYLHHIAIKTRNIEAAINFYSLFGFDIEHKFRAGPSRAAWLTNAFFSPPLPSSSSSLSSSQPTTSTDTNEDTPSNDNDTYSNDDNDAYNNMQGHTESTVVKGQSNNMASRIELIEVPAHILNEKENTIKRSIDLFKNESLLGLNHYALDVTHYIQYLKTNNFLPKQNDLYYGLDQFLEFIENQSVSRFNKTLRIALKPRQQVIGHQVFELAFLYDADGTIIELVRYIKEVELKDGSTMVSGWEPWDGKGFVGL